MMMSYVDLFIFLYSESELCEFNQSYNKNIRH